MGEALAGELGIRPNALYTIPSTAEILGVDESTVKRNKARIGFVRYGKRGVRFFGYQIVDFILAGVQEAKAN